MWIVGGEVRGGGPGLPDVAGEQAPQPRLPTHHHRQAVDGQVDLLHRPVDHPPDRGILPADDLPAGDQRPQPVEEMEERAAGDAGKEVLGPPGEPDHLMGEDRPQDDDQVIIKDVFVDVDRHPLPEKTAGNRRHFVLGELADPLKGLRQVPAVAEEARPAGQILPPVCGVIP